MYFWERTCGAGTILLHLAFIREIILCASDSLFEIYHRAKEASSATVLCASWSLLYGYSGALQKYIVCFLMFSDFSSSWGWWFEKWTENIMLLFIFKCITLINFFHEHVVVILLSSEASLDTLIFLCSPHPVLLFVKSVVLTNLSSVKVPQETLRLYSLWNTK